MDPLEIDDFSIHIEESTDEFKIFWKGKCRLKDPQKNLSPFLEEVVQNSKDKILIVDFTDLSFTTSSTFPTLLKFMRNCSEQKIETKFIYDGTSRWQEVTFHSLNQVKRNLNHIEILPK